MRGTHGAAVSPFSRVDLEKGIPARHPLRKVRQVVDDALARLDECPPGGNPAQCRSVRRETPASPHATPLRDGAGRNGANALVVPDTLSLLTLPPGSTDLNPVETILQYLRANRLPISIYDSCNAIVDACCAAWNHFGNDPNTVTSMTPRPGTGQLKGPLVSETPEGRADDPAGRSQKDGDARWTRTHGTSHCGGKNHVNVGRRHKPVRRCHVTDAAGQDSQSADHLLMQGNTGFGVWADAACRSAKTQAQL